MTIFLVLGKVLKLNEIMDVQTQILRNENELGEKKVSRSLSRPNKTFFNELVDKESWQTVQRSPHAFFHPRCSFYSWIKTGYSGSKPFFKMLHIIRDF